MTPMRMKAMSGAQLQMCSSTINLSHPTSRPSEMPCATQHLAAWLGWD